MFFFLLPHLKLDSFFLLLLHCVALFGFHIFVWPTTRKIVNLVTGLRFCYFSVRPQVRKNPKRNDITEEKKERKYGGDDISSARAYSIVES